MLDTTTKKRIDDCRDILVGKLPDPKAQIEQITIALIYKFMDDMDKEAIELGGKAKFFTDYKIPNPEFPNDRKKDIIVPFAQYAWDRLLNPKVTAAEMLKLYSEAISGMDKNPNIPQLFRDIFKNAFLPYRDPETLKLFLKTIGEFEYTHSEKLGDAFEYLLSVMGSQGDAGQFRTPRHIIDFLIAVINPAKHDKILDPACGTAGFLIAAYKHILLQNTKANKEKLNIYQYNQYDEKPFNNLGDALTPDERKKLINNFTGYDISPDMVRLSLVNLYLHGFNSPHIFEYDTLSSEERWNETATVVPANPPFMTPKGGIRPHKKFSISSNRSEVLFVDYIAEHLDPKGRAGIIVPEGVIFQSGTAYKELRKMLVENYLYAVVSLPAGVFNPYSGVKTSILLMDKDFAKASNEILFVKIENDGYSLGAQRTPVKGSQLSEAIELIQQFKEGSFTESELAHAVTKNEIAKNGDYNLSGEKYKVQILATSEFPIIKMGEVTEVIMGQAPLGSETNQEGIGTPFVKVGNFGPIFPRVEEWTTNPLKKAEKHDTLVCVVGATIGKINKGIDCAIGRSVAAIRPISSKINDQYLFYNLKEWTERLRNSSQGSAIGVITKDMLHDITLALPPLSIQEEIVAEIEGWQKIIDGAKAVTENYKPKIDIDPDWEMVELGEVCEVKSGGTPSRDEKAYWNGTIPWVGSTVCKDGPVEKADEFITEEGLNKSSAKIFNSGTTLIALVGATIGKTGLLTFDCTTNQNVAGLYPKDITNLDNRYLYFSCQLLYENFMRLGEGKFRMATLSFVKEQKIYLPPIETQRQIVAQIEQEQALVNANKQLIAIFEQKIKDRIAKV